MLYACAVEVHKGMQIAICATYVEAADEEAANERAVYNAMQREGVTSTGSVLCLLIPQHTLKAQISTYDQRDKK